MKLFLRANVFQAARKEIPNGYFLWFRNNGRNQEIYIATQEGFSLMEEYRSWDGEVMEKGVLACGTLTSSIYDSSLYSLHSKARHGFGPSLYDLGVILATKLGAGLIPATFGDPEFYFTSAEARRVFRFMYENRPDIEKTPIPESFLESIPERYLRKIKGFKVTPGNMPWMYQIYTLNKPLESVAPLGNGM